MQRMFVHLSNYQLSLPHYHTLITNTPSALTSLTGRIRHTTTAVSGSTSDPCTETYGGTSAFTQPETIAISDYIINRNG